MVNLNTVSRDPEIHNRPRTREPSEIDVIRGAYGDVGRDDFCEGEPNPDMPDTEYLLQFDVNTVGRCGIGGAPLLFRVCKWEVEFVRAGGVVEPFRLVVEDFLVGTEPLVPFVPLEAPLESVERSVLKLALDFLRRSLRNEGAMIVCVAH